MYELKSRWQEILFNFLDYLPSRRQWHPVPHIRLPLLRVIGLYDPLAILAITNQFYERAIWLHATKQTLNTFFWQAVPNRGPKHLEPLGALSLIPLRREERKFASGSTVPSSLLRSLPFVRTIGTPKCPAPSAAST